MPEFALYVPYHPDGSEYYGFVGVTATNEVEALQAINSFVSDNGLDLYSGPIAHYALPLDLVTKAVDRFGVPLKFSTIDAFFLKPAFSTLESRSDVDDYLDAYAGIEPTSVTFDRAMMTIKINDGRLVGVPLEWYSKLEHATLEQRLNGQILDGTLYWPDLDLKITLSSVLAGHIDLS